MSIEKKPFFKKPSFEKAREMARVQLEGHAGAITRTWLNLFKRDLAVLNEYIESSKNSADFWDALKLIEAALHREGTPLPETLALWRADVNEGKIVSPKPTPDHERNGQILGVVAWLVQHGMPATRNKTSSPFSACDAVAQEASLSYEAVASIWQRHQ